jgi:hypothetical protein
LKKAYDFVSWRKSLFGMMFGLVGSLSEIFTPKLYLVSIQESLKICEVGRLGE